MHVSVLIHADTTDEPVAAGKKIKPPIYTLFF